MSEAYQYALWRAVPDLQRSESINVGVVLYSPRLRFLGARIAIDEARLRALAPDADLPALSATLSHRAAVAAGEEAAGSVGALAPGERFGLLVAPASTIVQPGPVHTGLCDDAAATLEHLFARLVLTADASRPDRQN